MIGLPDSIPGSRDYVAAQILCSVLLLQENNLTASSLHNYPQLEPSIKYSKFFRIIFTEIKMDTFTLFFTTSAALSVTFSLLLRIKGKCNIPGLISRYQPSTCLIWLNETGKKADPTSSLQKRLAYIRLHDNLCSSAYKLCSSCQSNIQWYLSNF